jgi:hypothetical protein
MVSEDKSAADFAPSFHSLSFIPFLMASKVESNYKEWLDGLLKGLIWSIVFSIFQLLTPE